MIIPLRTDSPLRTTPYMNWAIIAANLVVFLLTMNDPNAVEHYILSAREPRLYQFFTYQFLHAGWMHITGNMLFAVHFGAASINDHRLGNLGIFVDVSGGRRVRGSWFFSDFIPGRRPDRWSPSSGSIAGRHRQPSRPLLLLLPRSNVTIFFFFLYFGVAWKSPASGLSRGFSPTIFFRRCKQPTVSPTWRMSAERYTAFSSAWRCWRFTCCRAIISMLSR